MPDAWTQPGVETIKREEVLQSLARKLCAPYGLGYLTTQFALDADELELVGSLLRAPERAVITTAHAKARASVRLPDGREGVALYVYPDWEKPGMAKILIGGRHAVVPAVDLQPIPADLADLLAALDGLTHTPTAYPTDDIAMIAGAAATYLRTNQGANP